MYNDLRSTARNSEENKEEVFFDLNKYEENDHDVFIQKNVNNEIYIYLDGCCYKNFLWYYYSVLLILSLLDFILSLGLYIRNKDIDGIYILWKFGNNNDISTWMVAVINIFSEIITQFY